MTLKFDCACGTRIGFDVEPEQGRMPQPLACPSCGTDLTETANREIAAAAEPAPAAKPGIRVARSAPAPAPAPPTADTAAESAPSSSAAAPETPAAAAAARKRARAEEPSTAPGFLARHGFKLAGLGTAVVVGYLAWFQLVGSKPKPVFVATTPPTAPFLDARLLDRDRLLVLTPTRVSVRSLDRDAEVWGQQIQAVERPKKDPDRRAPDSADLEDPDYVSFEGEPPSIALSANSVWVKVGTRLTPYGLSGGKPGETVVLPSEETAGPPDDAGWTFVGWPATPGGPVPVARLDFASGALATGRYQPPRPTPTSFSGTPEEDGAPRLPLWETRVHGGVVLVARLVEQILQGGSPAGAPPPTAAIDSALEKENLRASDSGDVARSLMKPAAGNVVEDVSRYEVTLLRPFGGTSWKGPVTGRPVVVPLRTLDLLVAGRQAIAFDRSGNRLWQATLGAPLQPRHQLDGFGFEDAGRAAKETSGRVYLIDRSTVTALNGKTGDAAWRLPTVGASEIVEDGKTVYVATTTAGPELAGHSDPTEVSGVKEVVMAVDAANGTVRWVSEKSATHTLVGNPGRYTWRAGTSRIDEMSAAMDRTRAIPTIQVSKVDPDTGKADWTWFRKGTPVRVAVAGTRILVQRPREILVLDHRLR